ncbi:MAG: NYN domain-containing protein [Pseudomonadota bacterium]
MSKVWIFIDFWNFQLTLNNRNGGPFHPDWLILGPWLTNKACGVVGVSSGTLEGISVYSSYDPNSPDDVRHHRWATAWLNMQPAFDVQCMPRKPKNFPRCSTCHKQIQICPQCHQKMKNTVEKGVDASIATDLIRLAWEQAYDIGVLVTLDADLIPAVKFLIS